MKLGNVNFRNLKPYNIENRETKNLNVFYILYSIFEKYLSQRATLKYPRRTSFLSSTRYIVRSRNVAGPAWIEKETSSSPRRSRGREEPGNLLGHPSGALSDVEKNRNVPDRLHGIDSSPANSRPARRGWKKVDGDTGTRTVTLC